MEPIVWAVAFVNVVGLLAMGIDKFCAWRGMRRIPEAYLLSIAAFTGAPGVWLGTIAFRHKTVKSSFRRKLVAATLVNVVWLAIVFYG